MNDVVYWTAIPIVGVGTFMLRFVFIGYLTSKRPGLEWARALRYTPAAILPALAMPAILYDGSGAWQSDPTRLLGAAVAVAVGLTTRNVLWTVVAGMAAVWLSTAALSIA